MLVYQTLGLFCHCVTLTSPSVTSFVFIIQLPLYSVGCYLPWNGFHVLLRKFDRKKIN